jgi:tRNA modification GTPase
MAAADTIVACATPWGRGAVAMVRLSGPDALDIARAACPGGPDWAPRRLSLRRIRGDATLLDAALLDAALLDAALLDAALLDATLLDATLIDEALVAWLPGPRTFTGEDTVELTGHGNPVLVEAVLDRLVALGARPARPGEFTRRALEHGRMDLVQAESLGALVAARAPAGVAQARAGGAPLRAALDAARERLLDLAAELEARLDHPGEDLTLEDDAAVAARLRALADEADTLAGGWRAGRVRLEGARVALVGPVNAGKSTLFNALLGRTRALVSPEPGTTRDVVEASLMWEGVEVTLLDTAGLREAPGSIEAAGMALARELREGVDLHLVVLPAHRALDADARAALAEVAGRPHRVVMAQADRGQGCALPSGSPAPLLVSAHTGAGLDALRTELRQALGVGLPSGARAALTSQRQHDLCRSLGGHAREAADALVGPAGPAVAAEACTAALERLAELTGADVREDVRDRLFARFCIGK